MKPLSLLAPLLGLVSVAGVRAGDAFELKDGDRVVLVGNTLIEREQRYGHWEAALTRRWPDRKVTFRNLGWSGDTVFGDARAGFDTPAKGFARLVEGVLSLKPTVIVVGYGGNEAFAGKDGLPAFVKGVDTLLDALAPAKARVVLLAPPRQEDLGRPLPDPTAHNKDLALYRDALRDAAKKRGLTFVDLYDLLPAGAKAPLTDNGLHLTDQGYWRSAFSLEQGLGLPARPWRVEIDAASSAVRKTEGVKLDHSASGPLKFKATDEVLPPSPMPGKATPPAEVGRVLRVTGLSPGRYTLRIDGKAVVTATAEEWAKGMRLESGPEFEQAERLREAIVAKNRLYFYRWRPANETYLFGFRKHEQGKNAAEMPLFDPLVEKKEGEIAKLKRPVPHSYELKADKDPAKEETDPEVERRSFEVADGFEVNLFAADPLLAKPTQMNFDAAGRLWVACAQSYPQILPGQKTDDKIVILEDTKGVGRADKATVFADGLLIPTGLEPGDGGVYVADSTDLLHLSSSTGKGKADRRRVLLSGFGTEDTHHILHTFRWGHDGNLYFNQSIYIHSHIETPRGVRRLGGSGIWQYRPEAGKLEVFARGLWNPWGHHFDRWGQSFATDGAGFEGVTYIVPGAGYATAVGMSRTLPGLNPGHPKYCGAEILSGSHLPEEWRGNLLTNDFRGHRVCRFVLTPEGSGYVSKQMPDLIKTKHPAFRPVDIKMGPDGAIYIADWYNPIIQHGEVDFRDPRRDKTHGRIWRVTAKGRPLVKRPQLVGAKTEQLLEALKSPEDWTRHFARRVLKERGAEVVPALAAWVKGLDASAAANEPHLLEALWTYESLDVVEPKLLAKLATATDARVRSAAVRVIADWADRLKDPLDLLAPRVADEHPQVRLEAVRVLARVPEARAAELAMTALDRPTDQFLEYGLWLTLRELRPHWLPAYLEGRLTFGGDARRLLFALQAAESRAAVRPLVDLLLSGKAPAEGEEGVLRLIATMGAADDLGPLLDRAVAEDVPASRRAAFLRGLADATRQRGVRPKGDVGRVAKLLKSDDEPLRAAAARAAGLWGVEKARPDLLELARDSRTAEALRRAAIDGLASLGGKASIDALDRLAADGEPPAARRAALLALVTLDSEAAARRAVELLSAAKTEEGAAEVVTAFLQRKKGPAALAAALKDAKLPADVAKIGVRAVRSSGLDAKALLDALTKAGKLTDVLRKLTPEQLKQMTADVARLGDAARGEAVFRRKDQLCLSCHAIGGAGGQVGPDLAGIGASAQVDYLIESLLEPSKAIKEGYHTLRVTTARGVTLTGIKVRETKQELVLRTAEDKLVTVAAKDIEEKETLKTSLMPEGLTDPLTRGELIDLVRFLSELGKGKYTVGRARVARRWQALEFTPQYAKLVKEKGFDVVATDEPALLWRPAYSNVAGALPREDLPIVAAAKAGVGLSVVRCQVEVSTGGAVQLRLNSKVGLSMWVNGKRVDAKEEQELNLKPGTHTLTFELGHFRVGDLGCELDDVPGSKAQARFVGGK